MLAGNVALLLAEMMRDESVCAALVADRVNVVRRLLELAKMDPCKTQVWPVPGVLFEAVHHFSLVRQENAAIALARLAKGHPVYFVDSPVACLAFSKRPLTVDARRASRPARY
jgi:hypothetical protein